MVKASAEEAGGQSNADGTVTITIGGDGGTVEGTANVTGKAVSMGEGTAQAVLKQLVQQFGATSPRRRPRARRDFRFRP